MSVVPKSREVVYHQVSEFPGPSAGEGHTEPWPEVRAWVGAGGEERGGGPTAWASCALRLSAFLCALTDGFPPLLLHLPSN